MSPVQLAAPAGNKSGKKKNKRKNERKELVSKKLEGMKLEESGHHHKSGSGNLGNKGVMRPPPGLGFS